MLEVGDVSYLFSFNNSFILGPLLKELIDNMQHHIDQTSSFKMYMYSAVSQFLICYK